MKQIPAVVILIALLCGAARGDDAEARRHYERATRAYRLQEWKIALDEFRGAYNEKPDAAFLFNIAQSQRQLGMYSEAAKSYHSYLIDSPNAPNRAQVEHLVQEMDRAAKEAYAKMPPPGTQPPETQPAPNAQPAPVVLSERAPWFKNVSGWMLTGLGLATVGVGVGFTAHSIDLNNQANQAMTLAQRQSFLEESSKYATPGYILIGVGAASTVAGVVIFAVAGARGQRTTVSFSSKSLGFGGTL